MPEDQNTEILVPQDEAIVTAPATPEVIEKPGDPDIETLQAQLATAKEKSEADNAARLDAEQRAQLAEQKAGQSNTNVLEARKTEAASLLSAHRTAFEQAKQKHTAALELGKFAEASDAQADMNTAQINLDKVTTYKTQLEAYEQQQIAQAKQPPQQQVSPKTKAWIDEHPQFNTDRKFQKQAIRAHEDAIDEGIRPESDAYFDYVNRALGLEQPDADDEEIAPKAPRREPTTNAAPVARSTPQNNGRPRNDSRVQLSPSEQELAVSVNPELPRDEALKRYAARKLQLQREGLIGKAH